MSKSFNKLILLSLVILFCTAGKCSWFNPKVKLPDVKLTFGDPITLTVPLKGQEILVGTKLPIPDIENGWLELVAKRGDTPAEVVLTVPRASFDSEAFRLRDPGTLPGGRELPKIAEGKLPSLSFEVEAWNSLVFYLGLEVAGVFAPTEGKEPNVQITLPITDNQDRQIGFITRITQDANGENGGYFISFNWNIATTIPNGFAYLRKEDLHKVEIGGKTLDQMSQKEIDMAWRHISETFGTK